MNTTLALSLTILLLSGYVLYQTKSSEHFDLSAAFVDLATYGEAEKYLYGH